MSDQNTLDKNRLFWSSRRGMLELDLLLLPFLEEAYPHLNKADQLCYQRLLEVEDQDLFAWFLRRTEPEDGEMRRIVQLIQRHAAAS